MSNKIKFVDPIVIIGVIISTAIALILVLIGQDQSTSLLIGLVLTSITLLIDIIARIKESEETVIKASTLEIILTKYPILFSTMSQIAQDYASVTKLNFDYFSEKANDTIIDCRDIMHGLSEGRMTEDIDRVKVSFGTRGIRDARVSVKTTAYAGVAFWKTKYGEFVFAENKAAVQRGVAFTRIWVQSKETLLQYKDILKAQHEAGIKTLIVTSDNLPRTLLEDYRVIDDKVVIKLELLAGGEAKTQLISIDTIEVERAINNFELVLKHAQTFDDYFSGNS